MIQDVIKEIIQQDYDSITLEITNFLKAQIKESKTDGIVFGLSGGIDSALVSSLCSMALGEKSLAILMPDSEISPKEETQDALELLKKLDIKHKILDINPIVSQYSKYIELDKKALGNLRARVRANILYYNANIYNYLVAGSSDKSEYLIGYFTKFGDGSCDVLPIISLYKLQVRELARHLEIPDGIINKQSSPHLWKNHTAQDELGLEYKEIDAILYCLFEKKLDDIQTQKTLDISKDKISKVQRLYNISKHKRSAAARIIPF